MIDASRLSKSLATALKDRTHGIPVQPNHSLPLRPAPLLPVRKSLTKCTENLTTSCPNIIPVPSSDREESDDGNELEEEKKKKTKTKKKKKKQKHKKKQKEENLISELSEINHRENDESNEITNRPLIGMNFYDSVPIENHSNEVLSESEGGTEFSTKKRKSTNDDDDEDDDISSIEKGAKILKTVETNNSENIFPDIIRYRVTDKKISQQFVGSRNNNMRDKIKIRSSITLKETLHKPYLLPECPEAVPIEIAQAINRKDLLRSDRNIDRTNCDTDLLKKKETDNRLIERSDIGEGITEDIGFTSLPSMPVLEEGKTDPLSGMLTPPKELINDEEEGEKDCQLTLIGEAASMLEAEMEKSKGVVNRVDKFDEKKQNQDNLSNLTTVFEIKIPGRPPELMILNNGQILPSEKQLCDVADDNLAEATIPESLTISVEPAFDERRKTDDHKNVGALDKLVKYASSLGKSDREDKLLKSFELSDDIERRKKAAENVVRQRIKRLNRKLEKFIKEENDLKFEISRTTDHQRLIELNPKINCARKRKENIEKHLDKLRSKEKSSLEMKIGINVPRIQVRKDLIESIPPLSPKSEEPCAISSPELRSINESDEISMTKSPPIVITISESDSSSSEEEETVETVTKDVEKPRLEETSVQSEAKTTRDTVIAENFTPSVPKSMDNEVSDIPESVPIFNEAEKPETIVSKESGEIEAENLIPESMNEEKKNVTEEEFETPEIAETEKLKSNDQIATSINEETPTLLEKNNFQNAQLSVPNFNACNCRRCLGFGEGQAKSSVAPLSAEINFPPLNAIDCEPKTGSGTLIEDNRNLYTVQNYPRDYRTSGNFSRDNGGANTDLSSPLQGHSALPLPPPYVQNLTAQGYPPPPFPALENHQTTQLQSQLPVSKSSSVVNLASKENERLSSPILAAHSLNGQQGRQEVPANLSVGKKIISSKEMPKGNFEYGVKSRIMTTQFPTLGNWAAEQIIRKPVAVPDGVQNLNTTLNQSAVYKPLGSDMYKMTATAVDIPHPPPSETAPSMWRPHPDQQTVATLPRVPEDRINKPNSYYRRDNQQFVNPQNNHHNLSNHQRTLYNMENGGYSGRDMPVMPYAVHTSRQNYHMTNNVNVNEYPGFGGGQQKVWQYQPATSGIWLNRNNNNNGNPIGVLPQQQPQQHHHHLQQLQQMVAPASSLSSSSSSYVKIQPAVTKNLNDNQVNGNVNINGMKKRKQFDSLVRYDNSHRENGVVALPPPPLPLPLPPPPPGTVYQERGNANIYLPNPTVIHGGPTTYIAVLQNQRVDNRRTSSSSGSINFGIIYPSQMSAAQPPTSYLKCLRCARPAPKFNCADCEVAFYCNEYCQKSHWMTHSIECRKKMPKLKKVN